jgi:lia operon protein LiaG
MNKSSRIRVARWDRRHENLPAALLLGVFLILLAAASAATPALSADRYEVKGDHVAIYNLAGVIEVVSGSGPDVVVQLTRGGDDAERLEVAMGPIGGAQTLRVIYPSRRVHYSRRGAFGWGSNTTLNVGEDGRFGDKDRRTNRSRVTISAGSGIDAHADLRIEVPKGRHVDVYLAVGSANATNVSADLRLDTAAASVSTENTRGALVIDVGSGSVSVRDADGPVDVDTGSGRVDISGVRGESLRLDTGSGGVNGAGIQVAKLTVDTGSGSVELDDVTASDVGVDTGSGHVSIDLRSDIERLDIDTGSGGVVVRLPEDTGAEVYVETGSGGIRSELPIELMHKDRDSMHGRIGDGRGRIHIETGSGGVRLLKS